MDHIGLKIKELRKKKDMTQEKLAECLNVSFQAVSKWETGITYPDISQLPLLADIFGVSADVLLGIDIAKSKKQAEIKEFIERYSSLHSQGKTVERLNLCREMQRKYPNDETVLYYLLRILQNGYMDEAFDEIVMLGEQLLTASNIEYKVGAISILCVTYSENGYRENALEYAKMIPESKDLLIHILEGDELIKHCQKYFWKVCDQMYIYMQYLLNSKTSGYTDEEKHVMRKTLYDIFYMIFSDGDFGYWEDRLARISFFMAMDSMKSNKSDQALKELEQMFMHIEKSDSFTEVAHTSLLVNKLKIKKNNIPKHTEETLAQTYLRYLTNNEAVFDLLINDDRYVSIKNKLATM